MSERTKDIAIGLALALALVVLLGLAWSALGPVLGGGEEEAIQQAICHDHLGDGWEPAGVAKHDDWSHYHVHCERSTGVLSSEEQWVTIPADDYEIITI